MNLHVEVKRGYFSPKETKVMELLAQGLMRSAIAAILHRSINTINKQISSIEHKLHAQNATHAVSIAVAKKIVDITEKTGALTLVFFLVFNLLTNAMDDDYRLRNTRGRNESTEMTEYLD